MAFPQTIQLNDKNIEKISAIYQEAYTQILEEIKTASNFGVANRKQILAQIRQQLQDMAIEIDDIMSSEIEDFYKAGATEGVLQLKKVGADVPISSGFNRIHKDAINALVDDTARAFAESIQGVNRSATTLLSKAVRDQITQQLAIGKIGGKALTEIKNNVVGYLENQGLDSLVDKAGRSWSLDRYAEMLIRTKAVEARNRGLANRVVENDYDLVEVSSHGASDVCADWEGKILSVSGNTPGYPTVADAEGDGLFHPNCKHAINVLVPELADITNAYDNNQDTLTASEFEQEAPDDLKDKATAP